MLVRTVPLPLAALLLLLPAVACLKASGDLAQARRIRCQQHALTQASLLECRRILSLERTRMLRQS
jgi:hypothetical protein